MIPRKRPLGCAGLALLAMLGAIGVACEDPDDAAVPPSAAADPLPAPPAPDEPFRDQPPPSGPAAPFRSPAVDRFSLADGTDVLLVERHTLPTVTWEIEYPTGTIADPPAKAGRAALCMWLLVQGGAPETASRLADMASSISVNWGLDSVVLQGFALTAHTDETLDLWGQILLYPGTSYDQLTWVRGQSQGRLLQERADPDSIAARIRGSLERGKNHPYARLPTATSYNAVTLQDCAEFRASLRSNGAHLFVAGDITHADVERKFTQQLAGSYPGPALAAPLIPASVPDPARIAFVDAPGATQATILMWAPGPTRTSPDYYSATVMASIFAGDSLTSRLGVDLREMMGSTYAVNGGFSYSKTDGTLLVTAPVAADHTEVTIWAMLADAAAMSAADVTDDEMSRARDGRITALPGRFATVLGTLGQFMDLAYYGLPFTYYDDFTAQFSAVDKASVRQAARDYLAVDHLHFIVVGDAKIVLPALRALVASGPLAGGGLHIVDADANDLGP